MIRVAIFRSEQVLTFEPAQSHLDPWTFVQVPYGSRIVASRTLGETVLIVPGETRPLTAAEAAERFR